MSERDRTDQIWAQPNGAIALCAAEDMNSPTEVSGIAAIVVRNGTALDGTAVTRARALSDGTRPAAVMFAGADWSTPAKA